jgi:hypothetical protein
MSYTELDEHDLKYIIEEEEETKEPKFRWEYSHESLTESNSIFKRILPDY